MPREIVNEVGETISRNTLADYLQKGGREFEGKFFRELERVGEVYEIAELLGTESRPTRVDYIHHYLSDKGKYVCSDNCGMPFEQMVRLCFEATPEEVKTIKEGKKIPKFTMGSH